MPLLAANASSGLQTSANPNLFPGMYRDLYERDHRIGYMEDLADSSVGPLDTGLGAPPRGAKGLLWKVAQQRRR